MSRLTEKDKQGNWCLKGMLWSDFHTGGIITKEMRALLYGALWKLMEYESTGLSPDDAEQVNDFERSQAGKLLKKLNEEQRKHRWIPIEEQLPKDDNYILLSFANFSVPLVGRYDDEAFYVGDDDKSCVSQNIFVNAWMPLPEPYREEKEEEV